MKPSDLMNSFAGSCRFLTRRLAPPLRRVTTWPTLAIALLGASRFVLPVSAQDCKLTVQAAPNVLKFGQTAKVDVRAHFPASAYAFASAEFDVLSTDPAWSFASAGAIVGTDVLGINVGQAHAPQIGIVANPSNPIRVWTGNFTPVSAAPALVEINVDPASFWYYPAKQTSSSVACDTEGGEDWIFVNPLYFGGIGAAPGRGTSLAVGPEGFVATAEEEEQEEVIVGLIAGVQPHVKVFNGVRLKTYLAPSNPAPTDAAPESLTVKTKLPPVTKSESLAINFTKIEFKFVQIDNRHKYDVHADFPLGDEVHVVFYRDGVNVQETVITKSMDNIGGIHLFNVQRVPDVINPQVEVIPSSAQRSRATMFMAYDAHFQGGVNVSMMDGSVRFVTDRVVVYARAESANNLKQIGLGMHSFEATGVRTMTVSPF